MSKTKKESFFWTSYSDLMTSLFLVMLLLFVLTIALLHKKMVEIEKERKATQEQLDKIKEIQDAVKELPPKYFVLDSINKRFSLRKSPKFYTGNAIFKNNADKEYLIQVGKSIKELINTLKTKYSNQDIRYIVLIEGMASNDTYPENYSLSYNRALAVKKLWDANGIVLDQSVCEVQIAGSGTGGIGRFSASYEEQNQRILIQIVPKIGEIK